MYIHFHFHLAYFLTHVIMNLFKNVYLKRTFEGLLIVGTKFHAIIPYVIKYFPELNLHIGLFVSFASPVYCLTVNVSRY